MGAGSRLKSALRTLLRRQQAETELDIEIRSYVDAITDEGIARGMSPAEARRQALAESGGLEQVKQAVRDQRASTTVESVVQDIRFGIRQLRHSPAFAWTAVITLGLGIGATTAIFSAVYALLIRPLPYPNESRLMELSESYPKKNQFDGAMISPDFVALRSSLRLFETIAGFADWGDGNLTGAGGPVRVKVVGITANFLPLLHVSLAKGRNFVSGEDRQGGPAVALLSHRLWEARFNGDQAIVGRSITLGGKTSTVVGVLPAHFIFPDPAIEPDLYIPAGLDTDTNPVTPKPVSMMRVIGLLRGDASLEQAQAELALFSETRGKEIPPLLKPWVEGREFVAEPLHRYLTGDDRRPLLILLACVGAVLLIACANVANLQLARTIAREHEMALRGALGARRLRLIRQSLMESMTLAAMGAMVGLGIASAVTWLIRQGGMPGAFPSGQDAAEILQVPFGKLSAAVEINGWVLAFTAGLAVLTTILFGLTPALGASRSDLRAALQGAARRISSARQQRRLRSVLLVAEIGLAVLLLTGAGLLIRSFVNVLGSESGFDPRQCLTAQMQRNPMEKMQGFVEQLLPRLQALPGVEAAAMASVLPLDNIGPTTAVQPAQGPLAPRGTWTTFCAISITADYFRVTGTRVVRGRSLNERDTATAEKVVVVNEEFARRYLRNDALGRQFRTNIGETDPDNGFTRRIVVGVVENVRYNGPEGAIEPVIYLPMEQVPVPYMNILLRTSVEPGTLSSVLRKTVSAVDPEQPVFDIQTMEDRISHLLARRRLMMLLIASFAGLALLLAGVGVYGVFTYWVSRRRQEMGIRLALGSSRGGLLRLIVMQAMRLILAGSVVGIIGAWFLDRLLASMLVGVKVHDPVSLSLAWALLTLVALLGSSLPAMVAARTDVILALHSE